MEIVSLVTAAGISENKKEVALTWIQRHSRTAIPKMRVCRRATSVPFLNLLKMRPVTYGGGSGIFELVVEERRLRTHGIAHGGVVAAVLYAAMGVAAAAKAPRWKRHRDRAVKHQLHSSGLGR